MPMTAEDVTNYQPNKFIRRKRMDIREYAEAVLKSLSIEGAEIKEINKTNGVVLTGIMIPTDSNMSPMIYVDQMMKDGLTPAEAATEVLRVFDANRKNKLDVDFIQNYEEVVPKLKARLYNGKTNAEVKRSALEYGFDDLIIVPCIELGEIGNSGNGTVKVTESLLKQWDKTADEVIDAALENSKEEGTIQTMFDVLSGFMAEKEMEMEMPLPGTPAMYVVSNKKKVCGAIQVCLLKEKLGRMFPNGYIVIPSSIHEVIVLPKDFSDKDMLDGMVNDVNDSQVAVEEQLGNKVYIF